MKIAIMAAGGLGGNYGARLAKDGHDVTFIARGAHLRAIRENGLTVKTPKDSFVIKPAKATDNPADVGPVDWILFTVKTYDTQAAVHSIRPMVGPNTTVITFQNGVESPEQIGAAIGRKHVVAAPTQIVSNIVAPGAIEQKSAFCTTVIGGVGEKGLTPRVEQIVDALKRAGVDASATPDGPKALWHKFILIAAFSGLATIAHTVPYDLLQLPEARMTLRAAMEEAYAVGRAYGITMDADIVERNYQFALNFKPGQKPSMQVDLEQGKRLEIDALSGAVLRLGAAKGIKTPVHQTIYVALKMEDERAKMRREK